VSLYEHIPHAHIEHRKTAGPVRTDAERAGINGRIGLAITTLVGTMACGYVFALIALLSLPSAISSHNLTVIIAWVSSNFLQLVLLPVIIVGQNLQARASDKRAEQTFKDAEAVLAEALQIQAHLAAQDEVLTKLAAKPAAQVESAITLDGAQVKRIVAEVQAGLGRGDGPAPAAPAPSPAGGPGTSGGTASRIPPATPR
jgi:hypothetical protein